MRHIDLFVENQVSDLLEWNDWAQKSDTRHLGQMFNKPSTVTADDAKGMSKANTGIKLASTKKGYWHFGTAFFLVPAD